ncbi:hypothetical protein BC938DRAFT_476466, partial [Jimgerdemannia flammicorona]
MHLLRLTNYPSDHAIFSQQRWALTYLAQLHPLIYPRRSDLRPHEKGGLLVRRTVEGIYQWTLIEFDGISFFSHRTFDVKDDANVLVFIADTNIPSED